MHMMVRFFMFLSFCGLWTLITLVKEAKRVDLPHEVRDACPPSNPHPNHYNP